MKQWAKGVSVLALAIGLAGCASKHPLGISSSQWEQMTFEEQVEATQRQVAVNAAGRYQRDERRRDQARLRISLSPNPELAHMEYTDLFHNQNNQADCVIQGEMLAQNGWEKAYPVHFVVRRGFPQEITIGSWDGRWAHSAVVDFDSMGVQICPTRIDLGMQSDRCFDVARSPQWQAGGEIQSGEVRDTFRGTAQCHVFQPQWKPNTYAR